jgi:hypothetical protein
MPIYRQLFDFLSLASIAISIAKTEREGRRSPKHARPSEHSSHHQKGGAKFKFLADGWVAGGRLGWTTVAAVIIGPRKNSRYVFVSCTFAMCELLHTALSICPVIAHTEAAIDFRYRRILSALCATLPLLGELQPLVRKLFIAPLAFLVPAVRKISVLYHVRTGLLCPRLKPDRAITRCGEIHRHGDLHLPLWIGG